MSLITRCPACGTMFKVVADQLKVSGGWVRCGQCAEVFDASAYLQHLVLTPTSAAADAPTTSGADPKTALDVAVSNAAPVIPGNPDVAGAPQTAASTDVAEAADRLDSPDSADIPSPALTLREPEVASAPGASFAGRAAYQPGAGQINDAEEDTGVDSGHSDFDPLGWKRDMLAGEAEASGSNSDDDGANPEANGLTRGQARAATAGDTAAAADSADVSPQDVMGDGADTVSFVRDARRKAFWRTPGMRALLAITALLLAVLLLVQVALQQRDTLAVLEPRLAPGLQALCKALGCELAPLRQIDLIVIDSSSFRRMGPEAYSLGFSVKNSGRLPMAMPSLEITLTDSQEQALVRRVISPAQFGAANPLLQAGSSFAGQVAFDVAADQKTGTVPSATDSSLPAQPLRIAGYRMLAFYP